MTAANPATLTVVGLDHPRRDLEQSADGRPHVSYFAGLTSFCWSGDPTDPIEVSYGGAGEPAGVLIEWPVEAGRAPLVDQLALFQLVCDTYLELAALRGVKAGRQVLAL